MGLLGIMTLNNELETPYFNSIAKQASSYNFTVCRFHPDDWNMNTNRITGTIFNEASASWDYDHLPLPELIYDRCFHSKHSSKSKTYQIIQRLKKKTHFLSIGLPNKWRVHEALSRHHVLATYLPKTIKPTTIEEVIHSLFADEALVIKPVHGSQGKGILFISFQRDIITMQTHHHGKIITAMLSFDELKKWLQKIFTKNSYIVQTYLSLITDKNKPFDMRVLLQKNAHGGWQEVGRGIKVGLPGSLVSNLHNGGSVQSFDTWIYEQPAQKQIHEQLNELIHFIPLALEEEFGCLFELGIDIGIDSKGHCWLLEVNSKPGYRMIKNTNEKAAEQLPLNVLRYSQFLKFKVKELK